MYTSFQLAAKYLQYYITASNGKGHGIHSPFVFDFILHVLNNKNNYQPPHEIEELRRKLLNNKNKLTIEDLGAGSRQHLNKRSVSSLAKTSVKPKKYAEVLYRLVRHYEPETIIELGTSLGVTTAYLSKAKPDASILTIEGSTSVSEIAKNNFQQLNCSNIHLIQGNFDDLLPGIINKASSVDLVYIDGNHRYKPTIKYFESFLSKVHNNSILVFDDIHWSKEMEQAWGKIKNHSLVRCSIDIFFLGFVFFREEFKEKQDFVIRF